MKKQINPSIKAHLLWSALILLSLLAVCAIPFALAQRNAAKQSAAKPVMKLGVAANTSHLPPLTILAGGAHSARVPALPPSQLPTKASGPSVHRLPILPYPKSPQVVLYDQYNNASTTATLSATFTDFPTFSADLADDFVVPGGQTWNVQSIDADGVYFNGPGPASSFNVFFYTDNGGFPGTLVYSATNQPFTQANTTFTVNLASPACLAAGTYWVEIQANMTFNPNGEWGWTDRTVQSNNTAAWQNPGGGFGVCPTWTRKLTCVPTAGGPDQVYRLNGTIGPCGGTPTATPTCTPGNQYVISEIGGSIVPGTTDIGNHGDDTVVTIALPFSYTLYDQTFASINLSSNGNAQFVTTDTAFTN